MKIIHHYESDLVRWLSGDLRFWERSGFSTMNRQEREAYAELLLISYPPNVQEVWRDLDFPRYITFPYLLQNEPWRFQSRTLAKQSK